MKFITLLFFLLPVSAAGQTIRIADNNPNAPGGANVFTGANALQNAINAAQSGDVVYIQPSFTSYGNANLGKRITLKGVGFNIPELGGRTSTLGTLNILNSSDGVTNISNTKLTGFNFTTMQFVIGTGTSTYDNIVIENVVGTYLYHQNCLPSVDNLVVRDSYINLILLGACSGLSNVKIYNNVFDGSAIEVRQTGNVLISNNLFFKATPAVAFTCGGSTGVRVEHNMFSGNGAGFGDLVNTLVVNNIFFGINPTVASSGYSFRDNTFSNNLILNAQTMPPPGNSGVNSGVGNIIGVSPQFTAAAVTTNWTASAGFDYTLAAGSPCINAATTGDNIGPSGGLYPFTTNMTFAATPMPVITQFGSSGVVPQNQPVKSNIKARSY